ncbi:hypothetical protein REPUB_Repub20aG0053800 [Reevesia pubescens]
MAAPLKNLVCGTRLWNEPREIYWSRSVSKPRPGVIWCYLGNAMLKFNVDGDAKGKPSPMGCDGVLRDSKGVVFDLFFSPLGVLDSNVAELNAIKLALSMFTSSKWTPLFNNFNLFDLRYLLLFLKHGFNV